MKINPKELWFNTPDSHSLCRGGGNGPNHPTQLYAVTKYVPDGATLLDYGCGSATLYEALQQVTKRVVYKGVDVIPKNIEWCKENWPSGDWEVNPSLHTIDQADKSFDVVYSRHVVDHMSGFETAMDEHKRVAKELVIVVLWMPLLRGFEHEIKNIVDQRGQPTEKKYENEFTNNYSRKLVQEYLESDPEWECLELTENVGSEMRGCDTVIVLKRR